MHGQYNHSIILQHNTAVAHMEAVIVLTIQIVCQ